MPKKIFPDSLVVKNLDPANHDLAAEAPQTVSQAAETRQYLNSLNTVGLVRVQHSLSMPNDLPGEIELLDEEAAA